MYCLGDPAFWAGALCLAGIVGEPGYGAYGGRGQPGEGEYLSGLTAEGMDDGSLHVLAVTVDGQHGHYRGWVDGRPATVPSFFSAATPGGGIAQIGGSSTSRSRRFHGDIAEVVHYNRVLTIRELHAIGHFLQHKYAISGAYTDERAALALAEVAPPSAAASPPLLSPGPAASSTGLEGEHGGGLAAATAGLAGSGGLRVQLIIPPERGCLTHRGALSKVGMEPCHDEAAGSDVARASQLWIWEPAGQELRWAAEPSQCLTWFSDYGSYGVWACDFAHSEFEYDPLAHRFCLVALLGRCVTQLVAELPTNHDEGAADAAVRLHPEGSAGCLQLEVPLQPLVTTSCSQSPRQLWTYTANISPVVSSAASESRGSSSGVYRYAPDTSLCLDRFASGGGQWGTWPCDGEHKPNQRFEGEASARACVASPAGQCVQADSRGADGAVLLAWLGDTHCLAIQSEHGDGVEGGTIEVVAAPCAESDSSQRWMYNASRGSFSPASLPPSQWCLEFTSLTMAEQQLVRVRPCARRGSGVAAFGSDPLVGKSQLFAFKPPGRYCAALSAATRFEIQRCLRVAAQPTGIAVAFSPSSTAGGECLRAPARFRMLEHVPCIAADEKQRWSFDVTGRLRWLADPTVCLRYFEEAANFAAWACAEHGDDQTYELQPGSMPPSFCVHAHPKVVACVTVNAAGDLL